MTSSAESGASPSGSSEPECALSPSVSATNSADRSLPSTGLKSPALQTFTPLMQKDWVGWDESTSSAEEPLVSLSPPPESKERKRTTVISGRKCIESLHSADPLGSLSKTLLASSRWHSMMCCLTWKVSATPRGRLLFRLVPSALPTVETGCGLLPTPSGVSNHGKNHVMGRMDEWGGSSNPFRGTEIGKVRCASFEEWMMGYPTGWSDLMPSETPLSRRSSKKSAAP